MIHHKQEDPMAHQHPDHSLIALGIKQPWVELILRGIKSIEVRSGNTRVRGAVYLYASKKASTHPAALAAARKHDIDIELMPKGLLIGTVEIADTRLCTPDDADASCLPQLSLADQFGWQLRNPQRLDVPLSVRFLPYGVWFYPFRRKHAVRRRSGR